MTVKSILWTFSSLSRISLKMIWDQQKVCVWDLFSSVWLLIRMFLWLLFYFFYCIHVWKCFYFLFTSLFLFLMLFYSLCSVLLLIHQAAVNNSPVSKEEPLIQFNAPKTRINIFKFNVHTSCPFCAKDRKCFSSNRKWFFINVFIVYIFDYRWLINYFSRLQK